MLNTLDEGCPKLKTYSSFKDVYKCMCNDWNDFQKIKQEAKIRAVEIQATNNKSYHVRTYTFYPLSSFSYFL